MDVLLDRAALEAAHARSHVIGKAWLAGEARRAVLDRFDPVAPGDADAVADVAAAVLADGEAVGRLLEPLVSALRNDPLFEPPLRVQRDPLKIGAVLIDHPAATISASVLFADALATLPRPRTVVLTGRRSVVRYHRAAGAMLSRWTVEGDRCRPAEPLTLADGLVRQVDGASEANLLSAAVRDVVTVTATLRAGSTRTMREFAIETGAPVRAATLDDRVSRTGMLLTFLRLSGRADAGEAFHAASRHPEHHLRWTAMREWLALDVRGALPRLRAMAMATRTTRCAPPRSPPCRWPRDMSAHAPPDRARRGRCLGIGRPSRGARQRRGGRAG